jgi:hypothetical protein
MDPIGDINNNNDIFSGFSFVADHYLHLLENKDNVRSFHRSGIFFFKSSNPNTHLFFILSIIKNFNYFQHKRVGHQHHHHHHHYSHHLKPPSSPSSYTIITTIIIMFIIIIIIIIIIIRNY